MKLNQALAERDLVPGEIERTVVLERPLSNKVSRARSHHSFVWTLSGTDRKRIDEASKYMASFEAVSPTVYWGASQVASNKR
jgi:hypothetical protein